MAEFDSALRALGNSAKVSSISAAAQAAAHMVAPRFSRRYRFHSWLYFDSPIAGTRFIRWHAKRWPCPTRETLVALSARSAQEWHAVHAALTATNQKG